MTKSKNKRFGKLLLWSLHFMALGMVAQSPSLINYQGAARLANGTPLDNRTVTIKFEIHQGSSGGNIVATEIQTVQTNLLGLFSTQIGKTTNISGINWQGNLMFLQVSMDTSAGSNFTSLGTQQMVSVPYAMHASSVPSAYTNNILSIGNSTYAMSPTVAVTPNTSITVSGLGTVTSVGTNTFDINIPAPVFTGQGNTTVNGTYPNYTVSSAVPSIAVSSSAAAGPSVTSLGSFFSINLPPPTFTNAAQNIITGSYPNFTVNTPTVQASAVPTIAITNIPASTSTVVSSGSSFSINVPPPTFTNSGPSTITGIYPNYTITSPASYTSGTGIAITSGSIINTLPHVIPTIAVSTTAAAGASVTSSGNSFSLNVPAPTFTNTGQNIITGSYPNFTVNTPTIGATPNTTITPSGLVTVLNPTTNSFVVGVQSPTFTNSSQNIITGTYPNYVVNTSSVSGGTGISVASGTVITNTAPDVVVNYTNTGQTIITGTYPNFFVNTPTVTTPPTVTGVGAATVSGAPNYVVNVATPTFTNSGPTTVTGAYPNFTINSTAAVSQTLTGTGIATVTGGPNYLVNVSTPVFNNIGQTIISGTYPNFSVNTPTVIAPTMLSGVGAATVSGGPNYVVNVATPVFNNVSQSIITGTYPNFSVNTPTTAGTSVALTATAAAGPSISVVGTNSFNINIPPANGWSTLGNPGTTSGTNFIGTTDAQGLSFRTNNNLAADISTLGYFGIGNVPGFASTRLSLYGSEAGTFLNGFSASPATAVRLHNDDLTNSNFSSLIFSTRATNFANFEAAKIVGQTMDHATGGISGDLVFLARSPANLFERMRIKGSGAVGINTSAPTATLHINGTMRLVDGTEGAGKYLTSDLLGNASWAVAPGWGTSGNAATSPLTNFIGTTDAQDLVFRTNNTEIFRTQTTGGLRFSAGFNHIISIQAPAGGGGNQLTIKAADAAVGGPAELGGNVIVQGGDQYNSTFAPYTAGNVIIRSGRNILGVSAFIKEGGAIVFQSVDPANTYFEAGRFDIDGNFIITGTATKPGTNTWLVSSDARLKTNVHSYKDGLKELLQINPVWYTYNGEAGMPKETFVGVIAQDLQQVSPYMVKDWVYKSQPQEQGTTYLGVDNGAMTYMIINSVKEQQKQIEELKKILEEQKKINDEQKKLIEELLKNK